MKNRDGADKHKNAKLTWVAYIGGPRESRRLLGDVILTEEDIVSKREFPDGCVPSTWSIDLHYPKKQYAQNFRITLLFPMRYMAGSRPKLRLPCSLSLLLFPKH